MAAYIAVFLPPEQTESLVVEAFASQGYVPRSGFVHRPRSRRVTIDVYASGCVVKLAPSEQQQLIGTPLERALAASALSCGATLVIIDADFEVTTMAEWDESGRRVQDVRNPDWAPGQRRYEDGDERIVRWQLEEIAGSRLGTHTRGAAVSLGFEGSAPRRVDEVLRAIDEGVEVRETTVQGRPAFRFASQGVTRTVLLPDAEAHEVRARLASAKS